MNRVFASLAIGLTALCGVGAAVALGGRKRRALAGIVNRDDAPRAIENEIDEAESRAYRAGAKGELEFIGAGMRPVDRALARRVE